MPVKIFIVEDHAVMREMLASFLEEEADFDVCGTARTAEEALDGLERAAIDLVLVDVSLPGMSGIDLVEQLQADRPELPCLMVSGHGESGYVERAFEVGARGYVMKGNPYEITGAIDEVLTGGTYLGKTLRDG